MRMVRQVLTTVVLSVSTLGLSSCESLPNSLVTQESWTLTDSWRVPNPLKLLAVNRPPKPLAEPPAPVADAAPPPNVLAVSTVRDDFALRLDMIDADNAKLKRQLSEALRENARLRKELDDAKEDNDLLKALAAKKGR
jgi:hypothetical protein